MIKIDNFPENEDQQENQDNLRDDNKYNDQSDSDVNSDSEENSEIDTPNEFDQSDNQEDSNEELEQVELPEIQNQVNADDILLENQKSIIEALIFASSDPITLRQLAKVSKLEKASVENIIAELNVDYQDTRRSFRIENIAGGYRMFTLPEFHSYINQAGVIERTQKLSQAALESLAVIAYKQPITRNEIERIRGVDCGGVLKNLMSKDLIVIDGRSDAPGKPILYRTSAHFLEFFGLPTLDHLPPLSEIEDHAILPKLKLVKEGEKSIDEADSSDDSEGDTINRLSENDPPEPILEEEPELQEINSEDDIVSN